MTPTPRIRKPSPSPARSLSGLLHRTRGKARFRMAQERLLDAQDARTAEAILDRLERGEEQVISLEQWEQERLRNDL